MIDESRNSLFTVVGMQLFNAEGCFGDVVPFGGGSVTVWRVICGRKISLVIVKGNRDSSTLHR